MQHYLLILILTFVGFAKASPPSPEEILKQQWAWSSDSSVDSSEYYSHGMFNIWSGNVTGQGSPSFNRAKRQQEALKSMYDASLPYAIDDEKLLVE